jgi:hypothetical protein
MSQQLIYTIHCPKCRHEQKVPLYESVNVKTNPELRDELMKSRLNTILCSQCQFSFRVDKPLLYHDPARRLMIYWIPTAEDAIEKGQEQFSECLKKLNKLIPEGINAPDVHLVFNRTELVERIFLFEAGLDERIIEYVKHMIFTKNLVRLDPAKKALLFNAEDSNAESLCFVVQDVLTRKLEAVLQFNREAYNALCEMFDHDEQTASLLELFPGPYISARASLLKEMKGARGERAPSEEEPHL